MNYTKDEICGARIGNILSGQASIIASKLYEQFRRRNDCFTVATNSKFTIEQIQLVKYYVFFEKHYNSDNEFERFTPSYDMAESWRRLSEKSGKNIKQHDILLLKHELLEIAILAQNNMSQMNAHAMANKTYNYQQASDAYYMSLGIGVK